MIINTVQNMHSVINKSKLGIFFLEFFYAKVLSPLLLEEFCSHSTAQRYCFKIQNGGWISFVTRAFPKIHKNISRPSTAKNYFDDLKHNATLLSYVLCLLELEIVISKKI